ncbi:hypothetical protein, partial [Streptomyces sp. NPDC018347]|uniref:hypothetical protein n=1 Tax=Streptomyces sp. NPDC018347 TaxID=3157193 RepID=UPI0033D0EFDA
KENERITDTAADKVLMYRQIKDERGAWLAQPRVFLPHEDGGWVERTGLNTSTYEGFLASANKAHDAAQKLFDIGARSERSVPEHERLDRIGEDRLKELYWRGSEDDKVAALYEWVRRSQGISLRYTQLDAVIGLGRGEMVNMAAGEGKSWVFFMNAALQAAKDGVSASYLITPRDVLANREILHFEKVLGDWAYVHRMNSDAPPPAPGGDKPTIYIGTSEDVAFGKLKHGLLQGQSNPGDEIRVHVAVDEADEAFVYANPTYILSEGAQREAAPQTVSEVNWAGQTLKDGLDRGVLDETDFGLGAGHLGGGGARLTEAGRARLEAELQRGLSEQEVHRLNMAALAQWVYKPKIHYAVHDGKIFIIDQNSHKVL